MNNPPNNDNNNDNGNADNDAAAPVIAAVAEDGDHDDDEEEEEMFDPAEIEQICTEAMTLLQNRSKLPSRLRDRTMVRFAQQFIKNVKEDIHKMLTDTRLEEEGYDGLDSERDTDEEVATAICCCPDVLSRRDERFGFNPIQCVTFMQNEDYTKKLCNVKAVSFVPLFVQLAMEFNSFSNEERGGLLIDNSGGNNILHDLVSTSHNSCCDEEHQQRVDTTFLAVLIRLRRSGYFLKNDIQHCGLVHKVVQYYYFPERRFRFLTEWDP